MYIYIYMIHDNIYSYTHIYIYICVYTYLYRKNIQPLHQALHHFPQLEVAISPPSDPWGTGPLSPTNIPWHC